MWSEAVSPGVEHRGCSLLLFGGLQGAKGEGEMSTGEQHCRELLHSTALYPGVRSVRLHLSTSRLAMPNQTTANSSDDLLDDLWSPDPQPPPSRYSKDIEHLQG